MFILVTARLLTPFQKSAASRSGSGSGTLEKLLPAFSITPSRMYPPKVLAKAEEVSQMLWGNPPWARLASRRLFSLYPNEKADDVLNLKRLFSLQDFNPFSWKKEPEPFAEQIDEKVLRSAAGECVIYSHTGTSFAADFYFAQQFQPFAYGFFRSAMMLCQTGNIRAAAKFL